MDMTWFNFYLDVSLTILLLVINMWMTFSILYSKELNKNFILIIFLCLITNDTLRHVKSLFHDVPSQLLNRSIMPAFLNPPVVVIQSARWFGELLFLPLISLLHVLAIYSPFVFRRLKIKSIVAMVIFTYSIVAALTAPLFTSCCGYIFYEKSFSWFFDFSKPYTYVYMTINYYLQAFCIFVLIVANLVIVWRLYKINREKCQTIVSVTLSRPTADFSRNETEQANFHGQLPKKIRSREFNLACGYVLLSSCFLISTLSYNFIKGRGEFGTLFNTLASSLNMAKWILYSLFNQNIRRIFLSPLTSLK